MSDFMIVAAGIWTGVSVVMVGPIFSYDASMPVRLSWIFFWPLLGPIVGLLGIVEMWQSHSVQKRARLEAEYRRAVKELEGER